MRESDWCKSRRSPQAKPDGWPRQLKLTWLGLVDDLRRVTIFELSGFSLLLSKVAGHVSLS
jgi:hypothetical protein